MAVKDTYSLLSTVVSIANSGKVTPRSRLVAISGVLVETFGFASASFYLPDADRRNLTSAYSGAFQENPRYCRIPFGEGVCGEAARRKAVQAGPPESLHTDETPDEDISQLVAFPVVDEGRVSAVLAAGLADGFIPPHHEKKLLHDILVVVGGLVRTMQVAEWSERRVVNLTTLAEIGKITGKNISPPELLRAVLARSHKLTGSCCTVLRLVDGGEHLPGGVLRKIDPPLKMLLPLLLEIEGEVSQRVTASGVPLLLIDLVAEEDLPPSYICVPLFSDSTVIGTMTFFGKGGKRGGYSNFDEEDRDLCENLATIFAAGIDRALTMRKLELLHGENRKKLQEFTLLFRMGQMVLSTINLNKLSYLILSALTSGSTPIFDRAMLFLVNEKAGNMQGMLGITRHTAIDILDDDSRDFRERLAAIDEEEMLRQMKSDFSSQVRGTRIPLDRAQNASSRAVLDMKLIHVPNVEKEKAVDREFIRKFGVSSFAAVPLIARQRAIGVIVADNHVTSRAISPDELRFLQTFANQAGMAMENSMLYSRVQEANRELYETQERLLQGERLAAIGEMAAGIAHELKNPLVSIGGFGRRILKRLPAGSDEWKCAETIVRETERLERMLGDILAFSRKATICYTSCSIVDIISDALTLLGGVFQETGISVVLNFPPAVPPVMADAHQLKQVFVNLFTNAQEAMRSGGVLKVIVFATKLNGLPAIAIRISDTGKGIPPETAKKVFTPFYTTKPSGTGLGLSITARIIANHKGKIRVTTAAGGGAEFRIVIPVRP